MPTLARPRVENRTPEDLVNEVRRGLIRLPPFQRGYKWEADDVVKLFDSLLRGYPVGNLLLWRRRAVRQHLHIGPLDIDAPETDDALWVVDGQQRITSLVGALVAAESTTDSRFRVHLDLNEATFHTIGARQVTPTWWIPVSRLLDTHELLSWMRENSTWLTSEQIALADQAAKAIREYQIPTYIVTSAAEEPLIEIFARMNTHGKRLTEAEVFHALHTGLAGAEPSDLRGIGQVSADWGFGAIGEKLALRCALAFTGGYIFRDDFQNEFESAQDRVETLREVAGALRGAIDFLRDCAGIPHVRLLPYSQVLPILVRFVHLYGSPAGRTTTLLRRWVWRTAVSGATTKSTSAASIRSQVKSLDETGDALSAAQALLGGLPGRIRFAAELDKVHFSQAMAKINVLALLTAEPREPSSGQVIEIAPLVEAGSPIVPLFADKAAPGRYGLANRVISAANPSRGLRDALAHAAPEVALSQLIDAEAQQLLRAGDHDGFLRQRGESMVAFITSYVAAMAEWGARDGPAVRDMIRAAV